MKRSHDYHYIINSMQILSFPLLSPLDIFHRYEIIHHVLKSYFVISNCTLESNTFPINGHNVLCNMLVRSH